MIPAPTDAPDEATAERVAAYLLGVPLIAAFAALIALQLFTWVPHYLTWPIWADHDVFATMAHAWDAGDLPYRDMWSNNFPGTIYLFWLVGRTAGWGNTAAFYAVDVALLLMLGALLLVWSIKRFDTLLPGLLGFAAILSYYLGLDFTQTAQRDWHGPLFAVAGLLIVQTSTSRSARLVSALAMAIAVTIRPQAVLLLPAMVLAVADQSRPRHDSIQPTLFALGEWSLCFAIFTLVAFLPLIVAGVLGDFLHSLRLSSYGPFGSRSFLERVGGFRLPIYDPRLLAIPLSIAFLAQRSNRFALRTVSVWILALAGALAAGPVSPAWRAYLVHPVWLVWCVSIGVLTGLVLRDDRSRSSIRLVAIILISSISIVPLPKFGALRTSLRALASLRSGLRGDAAPLGYTHRFSMPLYNWGDYRATLDYITMHTGKDTRIANLLIGAAVTGPTARLSAFPAESATWLEVVATDDEAKFVQSLKRTPNSIVVWAPSDLNARPHELQLRPVIIALYDPEVRFGAIEIWRRKKAANPED